MKRIPLTVLGLCSTLFLAAEPISKQAALFTAKAYMIAKGKAINTTQKPYNAPRKSTAAQTGEEEAYYYVFNAGDDKGYVIVSGDDRVEPILGYVDQGNFDPDNIPENMQSWLQLYADQIKYIIDNDIQPEDPIIRKRNKVSGTKHSIPELLSSRWNQGHPYNITCPKYYKGDGTQDYPASGCVATAMAQVVYYYKFPEKTKAAIASHSCTYTLDDGTQKTVSLKAIPRNTVIDWENMRDTYSWQDFDHANVQDTAVANLMLYCGQGVKMGYGASSGAVTSRSRDFFVNCFGYDKGAFWASRGDFSIDQWFNMIYDELQAGYPVLFSGHSSKGGHAFILDGFDGDNLFHVNWGWGGGSNGYFLVSILNPGDTSGIGASSSSDGYSMSQGALINLRVPGTTKEDAYLFANQVTINGTTVKATFTNRTGASGNFHAGMVMLGDDGQLSLVGSRLAISSLAHGASTTKTFQIANKLPEGTYRLSPANKPSKSEEWRAEYDFRTQYIEAVVDSTGAVSMQFLKPVPTAEAISIDTIVFPGTRIVGKEQEVKVTFRNDGTEYIKTVCLLASKTTTKTYTESKSMVAVRSGETTDVSFFFTPEETGTYNLWFSTDDKGNNVIGQGTIEVITEDEAVKASLAVNSYTITNLVNGVLYGKLLMGKVNIKNNANTDFDGRIRLQLWHQEVGANVARSGTSKTFDLNVKAGKVASVDFSFDNLNEGYYYRIRASYVNQDGELTGGGIWTYKWEMKSGILIWKNDGTPTGKAYSSTISPGTNACGVLADCSKDFTRFVPNKNNPNAIYAFGADMTIPNTVDGYNVVSGNHADSISLVSGYPYAVPASFEADSASFIFTFPETEDGSGWHAFTMPFEVDSIFLDDKLVQLNDSSAHFWIYEFSAEDVYGLPAFKPATKLRGGMPYIIAGDTEMAGQSVVFRSLGASFYKTSTDKMLVTSQNYKFHGNTLQPRLKDCYMLNDEGTAFEFTTTTKVLTAMAPYFTTSIEGEDLPTSIVLPPVPVHIAREAVLSELSSDAVTSGSYDKITLRRTFEDGLNTICLPFGIDDIEAVFGEGAKAYKYEGLYNNNLQFVITERLTAAQPYILSLPEATSEDIILTDISIDENGTQAGSTDNEGTFFCGTYTPVTAGQWPSIHDADVFYTLQPDGTVVKADNETCLYGFRAFFDLPETEAESLTVLLFDNPTGIGDINGQASMLHEQRATYNLAGQRIADGKQPRGIYIVKQGSSKGNGKKFLK